MKLHSYTFPVKLENEGYENFKYTAPYTMTATLQIEESHYVGYTFTDSSGVAVDVLDIFAIKDYVKANPSEFTNVRINEISGQLDIDGFEDLDHLESLEYKLEHERVGLSSALFKLLEVKNAIFLPRKIYKYNRYKKNANVKCMLTNEFKSYLRKVPANTKVVIPPPLLNMSDSIGYDIDGIGERITIFANLFYRMKLANLDVDFSLFDLRNCEDADSIFSGASVKELNLCTFNLIPYSITDGFADFCCEKLSFNNCNFSDNCRTNHMLQGASIGILEATNFKIESEYYNGNTQHFNVFPNASIDVLDMEFFANITTESLYNLHDKNSTLFFNTHVGKLLNIDKIATYGCKAIPNLFKGLVVEELDVRNLRVDSLEDYSRLFSGVKTGKFKFNPKIFAKATNATAIFKEFETKGNLDLSKADFSNLQPKSVSNMFESCVIEKDLTLPPNFGEATNFVSFCAKLKTNKVNVEEVDFSKAETMEKFFYKAKVNSPIKFPSTQKLRPSELTNVTKFLSFLKAPEVNLIGWTFYEINADEFDYIYNSFGKREAIKDKFNAKTLGVDVLTFKFSLDSQIYEAVSKNKQWNYYYNHELSKTQVVYNRDQNLFI